LSAPRLSPAVSRKSKARSVAAPYEVHPYSKDVLIGLIAELSRQNTPEQIATKSQTNYLDGYFEHAKVTTVLVERCYVDRDYLEDFAAYYVRCFEPYERYCSRLHFFSHRFDAEGFNEILSASPDDPALSKFRESYCGFIVIKPLPQTVIGRTCLKTYTSDDGRTFPAARRFSANLFGISLDIAQTLPFQEQDRIVAACATSALWSVLQATAKEFQHSLLTPIEITRAATELSPTDNRMIPNRDGLSTAMMAEAIRSVQLEPLHLQVPRNDEDTLRSALYAYLQARIPLILGIALFDVSNPRKPRPIGEHAVAVTGYHLDSKRAEPAPNTGFRQVSKRIDKIYVHDDQLGPFARMKFDGRKLRLEDESGRRVTCQSLSTSLSSQDGTETVRAFPRIILVPLYHKIRIPYDDVFQAIIKFDGFLKTLRGPLDRSMRDLEWDIHLTTVNDLKIHLQRSCELQGTSRLNWLSRPMPRFLWRASARTPKAKAMEILFDATDIHTSNGVHGVIFYDAPLEKLMRYMARSTVVSELPDMSESVQRILRTVTHEFSPPAAAASA
jgi:hypothetical protein